MTMQASGYRPRGGSQISVTGRVVRSVVTPWRRAPRRIAQPTLNPVTKRAKIRVCHWVTTIAAVAAAALPLTAAVPATAEVAGSGMTQVDTVTQWNLTMIAALEAAGVPA